MVKIDQMGVIEKGEISKVYLCLDACNERDK